MRSSDVLLYERRLKIPALKNHHKLARVEWVYTKIAKGVRAKRGSVENSEGLHQNSEGLFISRPKYLKGVTKIAKTYNKNNFEISFIGIETATYFHPIMNINSGIFIVIPCFMQHTLIVTKSLLANPVHFFCQSTVPMSGWFEDSL